MVAQSQKRNSMGQMMAIILLRDGEKTYASGTGRLTGHEKERAEKIFQDLETRLGTYETNAINNGYILSDGTKKNALRVWYDIGKILDEIADKYKILGTSDEPYYWQSIYDHVSPLIQKSQPPQKTAGVNNHFKRCALMARKRDWAFVQSVGNWSTWRDLLDNIRLQQDSRVFKWVVDNLHDHKLGHKEARPFVHAVRRSIKGKDTTVLTDQELTAKLRPLKELIPRE